MSLTTTSPKPDSRTIDSGLLKISWTLTGSEPALVQLQSVLDRAGSEALDRALAGALNLGYRHVVLDLTRLERVTAGGAEGLLKSAAEARRRSARLVLASPLLPVRDFLRKLGITGELEIADTVEAASRT